MHTLFSNFRWSSGGQGNLPLSFATPGARLTKAYDVTIQDIVTHTQK